MGTRLPCDLPLFPLTPCPLPGSLAWGPCGRGSQLSEPDWHRVGRRTGSLAAPYTELQPSFPFSHATCPYFLEIPGHERESASAVQESGPCVFPSPQAAARGVSFIFSFEF